MNIREIAGAQDYSLIAREERNHAAILYAALCQSGNPQRFLQHLGIQADIDHPRFGIFFEYSYLRDLWKDIGDDEKTKSKIIREFLPIKGIDIILKGTPEEVNMAFGVGGRASVRHVQNPGKWAMVHYAENFKKGECSKEEFRDICRFKWSFNIKPDIVIHLDESRAVCIEAKDESTEGRYPSNSKEKDIFNKRHIRSVRQLELQEYMMKGLLGYQTVHHVLVVSKAPRTVKHGEYTVKTWADVFGCLDMAGMPAFARRMASAICQKSSKPSSDSRIDPSRSLRGGKERHHGCQGEPR